MATLRYTIASVETLNNEGATALRKASSQLNLLRTARTRDGTRHALRNLRENLDEFERIFEEAAPHIKG